VPAANGDVWFKEAAPAVAFEPALTVLVAERWPQCSPEVLAAEGARMMTRDAGVQMRASLEAGEPRPRWEEIVALYAELQIDFAGSVDELLALGVPDSRPETLAYPVEGPVPLSLIHEEIHDGNVHIRDGRPVFIDWAEASVSHPFAGMTNTLRIVSYRLGWEPGSPEVLRLRDSYQDRWTLYAPLDELRELFARAYAFGALVRATTWERILEPLSPAAQEDYPHNVEAWREIHAEALRAPDRLGA
jgi:aminoglycoside phosphotransferase (APT) family kinase protein